MGSYKWLFLPSGPADSQSCPWGKSTRWGAPLSLPEPVHSEEGSAARRAHPADRLAVTHLAVQVRLPLLSWDEEVATWPALPQWWSKSHWWQALSCPGSQGLIWKNFKDVIHSFLQIFVGHQLYAWHCARCWMDNSRHDGWSILSSGANQHYTSHKLTDTHCGKR